MKDMITPDILTAIADAIREKTKEDILMTPPEMPEKIMSIKGGGSDLPQAEEVLW